MASNDTVQFQTPENPLRKVQLSEGFASGILLPALVILAVILAGVGTGWVFSKGGVGGVKDRITAAPGAKVEEGGKEVGLEDEKTFRDQAEGVLEEGGIDGEGTHHLVREGGPSQNVYLTSSVVDLDAFTGKKVQVWGETFAAQKAGWLMDVGRVRVVE